MQHLNIKISGDVQGVFFRASAKNEAERLAVKGFVKNEDDGSVYIEAEGNTENLRKFVEWCRQGPSKATVKGVDTETGTFKDYKEFNIVR